MLHTEFCSVMHPNKVNYVLTVANYFAFTCMLCKINHEELRNVNFLLLLLLSLLLLLQLDIRDFTLCKILLFAHFA